MYKTIVVLTAVLLAGPKDTKSTTLVGQDFEKFFSEVLKDARNDLTTNALGTDFKVSVGGEIKFKTSSGNYNARVLKQGSQDQGVDVKAGPLPTEKVGVFMLVVSDRAGAKQTTTVSGNEFCDPRGPKEYLPKPTTRVVYEVK